MRKALAWLSLVCSALALNYLSATEASDKIPRPPGFRADVDTVIVPVTVSDPYDRFVVGMEKEHFKTSGSMSDNILSARNSEPSVPSDR